MTNTGAPARRPGLVTLLIVLVVIGGVLSVIGGIALIFLKDNPDVVVKTGSSGVGLWAGIGTIIVGLIYLAVAKGLSNGNGFSRLIVAIAFRHAAGWGRALGFSRARSWRPSTKHTEASSYGWSSATLQLLGCSPSWWVRPSGRRLRGV